MYGYEDSTGNWNETQHEDDAFYAWCDDQNIDPISDFDAWDKFREHLDNLER